MQGLSVWTISQVFITNLVVKGFGSKLTKNYITKAETFILASSSFTLWWIPFENEPTRCQKLQKIEKQNFKTQKINKEKNYRH